MTNTKAPRNEQGGEKVDIKKQYMKDQLSAINDFVAAVEREAEHKMLVTGKLEGAHYAAMKQLQKEINDKINKRS